MARIREQQSEFIEIVASEGKYAAFVLEDKLGLTNYRMMDDKTIRIYAPEMSPVELSRALILNEVGLEALNKKRISLEEHFLKLIQGADGHA